MEVIQRIQELYQEDLERKRTLESMIQKCPQGRIDVTTIQGYPRYYWVNGSQKKYLNKDQAGFIASLIGKPYYRQMLQKLDEELAVLQNFLAQYDPNALIRIYENMSTERKKLIRPLALPDDLFAKAWMEECSHLLAAQTNPYPKPDEYQTRNGEFVRSKSEKILADTFAYYGLFYVYECPLFLDGVWVYPDFRLLNLRTRQTWYWEHFGMMDNPEYAEKAIQKIHRYENSGIFIGESLIVTMETSKGQLSSKEIDLLIHQHLL